MYCTCYTCLGSDVPVTLAQGRMYLSAETLGEMKDWVFALKAAIEKANARCRRPTGELPEVKHLFPFSLLLSYTFLLLQRFYICIVSFSLIILFSFYLAFFFTFLLLFMYIFQIICHASSLIFFILFIFVFLSFLLSITLSSPRGPKTNLKSRFTARAEATEYIWFLGHILV